MFDFGNKKLIEDLKREVKFQNNLVGVGLAIQDELKKKNEMLEKEKIEYQKTIEYLTNEIDKLKDEKEELRVKWSNEREYDLTFNKLRSCFKENNIEECYFEIEDINYEEIKNITKKYDTFLKFNNSKYEITYFKKDEEILTPSIIKNMIKNKKIPMYNGIPFRKLQDLYKIMEFLESEKNVDYKTERYNIDFYNKIKFCNKKMYFQNIEINNKNIKITLEQKSDIINFKDVNFKLYNNYKITTFNNKEFKNVKELMKLIKEKCYKDKELLISVINNL